MRLIGTHCNYICIIGFFGSQLTHSPSLSSSWVCQLIWVAMAAFAMDMSSSVPTTFRERSLRSVLMVLSFASTSYKAPTSSASLVQPAILIPASRRREEEQVWACEAWKCNCNVLSASDALWSVSRQRSCVSFRGFRETKLPSEVG